MKVDLPVFCGPITAILIFNEYNKLKPKTNEKIIYPTACDTIYTITSCNQLILKTSLDF